MNRQLTCLTVAPALLLISGITIAETHWEIQAVDHNGRAIHPKAGADPTNPSNKVVLEGIVLNNHEDMLDPTYDAPAYMGGQWQIFVQGEGADHAGTALWMGQKYSRMGNVDYTQAEWSSEMARINYDGAHQIRMGDRVRVTGFIGAFRGKTNVNERHSTSPALDFEIEYLDSGVENLLAIAETITLSDVKDDNNVDIFVEDRTSGAEYYQGRLVRINDVRFSSGTWGKYEMMEITDGTGRTLPVRLGIGDEFSQPPNLEPTFDIVGIFNQEDKTDPLTGSYELWVAQYHGQSDFLGVPEPASFLVLITGGSALIARRRRITNRARSMAVPATAFSSIACQCGTQI